MITHKSDLGTHLSIINSEVIHPPSWANITPRRGPWAMGHGPSVHGTSGANPTVSRPVDDACHFCWSAASHHLDVPKAVHRVESMGLAFGLWKTYNKTMDRSTIFHKYLQIINGSLSIAMLNYQRVTWKNNRGI